MNDWQVPTFESSEYQSKSSDYCVCVFVINEGERLLKQLERMQVFADRRDSDRVDIVIADGGSKDKSTSDENLRSRSVNTLLVKTGPGKLGSQMRMAYSWALKRGYQGVIVVDGNNKDGVEAIPSFVEKLRDGFDHVQGSRFILGGHHKNTPISRLLGVKLLHAPAIRLASGFRYTDTTNGFRAYSSKLLADQRVALFRDVFTGYELHYYLAIRAARLGFQCVEIPVSRVYPSSGKTPTKISPFRGNLEVIRRLLACCRGAYDPPSDY